MRCKMVLPCLIVQMLAAIGEDQTIEVCPTAWFPEQHALCRPVQPTPQSRHGPAQLTVRGQHGALMAHPPQATAPVLHLEIDDLRSSLEIELHNAIVQPWQISTA